MSSQAPREPDRVAVVVGDFADPLSFLASQRVDQVRSLRLCRVHWLAVESDPGLRLPGCPLSDTCAQAIAELSLPGENIPTVGVIAPNSRAATAAYAESVTDGVRDAMRRALYDAAWVNRQLIADPEVIRRIVFAVLNPNVGRVNIGERVQANRSVVVSGTIDPIANTRRLGYVVTSARGPLTGIGQKRIDRWRQTWKRCGAPPLPLLITDDGARRTGPDALHWLAQLLPAAAKAAVAGRSDPVTLLVGTDTVSR